MFYKSRIEELEKEVKNLNSRVTRLCELLGFFTHESSGTVDKHVSGFFFSNGSHVNEDCRKQPVTQANFDLLLDHLKLRIEDESKERRISPLKPAK